MAMNEMDSRELPPAEAFSLIVDYALLQGWTPIGLGTFNLGAWTITVNGTPERVNSLDPYHALVTHRDCVAFLLLNPYGATGNAEREFIDDVKDILLAFRTGTA